MANLNCPTLLQKQVILIKKSNPEVPHLDMYKKDRPINLDKSIRTYHA
jgi:hypothetical protein